MQTKGEVRSKHVRLFTNATVHKRHNVAVRRRRTRGFGPSIVKVIGLVLPIFMLLLTTFIASCINRGAGSSQVCIVTGQQRTKDNPKGGFEVWTASSSGSALKKVTSFDQLAGDWTISRHVFLTQNSLPIFSGKNSAERKVGLLSLRTGQIGKEIEDWGISLFPQPFFGDSQKIAVQVIDESSKPRTHYVALWNDAECKFDKLSFPEIDEVFSSGGYISALGGWDDTLAVLVKSEKKGIGGPGGKVSSWCIYLFDIAQKKLLSKIPFKYMTDNLDEYASPDMKIKDDAAVPGASVAANEMKSPADGDDANDDAKDDAKPSDSGSEKGAGAGTDDGKNAAGNTESKPVAPDGKETPVETALTPAGRFLLAVNDFSFLKPPDESGFIVIAYNSVRFDTKPEPDGTRLNDAVPMALKLNIANGEFTSLPLPEFAFGKDERKKTWVTRYSKYDAKNDTAYIQFRTERSGPEAIHPIAALTADDIWSLAAETKDKYSWFAIASDGSLWYSDMVKLDNENESEAGKEAGKNVPQPRPKMGKAMMRLDPKTKEARTIVKSAELLGLFTE